MLSATPASHHRIYFTLCGDSFQHHAVGGHLELLLGHTEPDLATSYSTRDKTKTPCSVSALFVAIVGKSLVRFSLYFVLELKDAS